MIFKYKKEIFFAFVSFVIFLSFSIYITYPLIFHMGDVTTGLGDELLIAWIQNWVIHSLKTNPLSLFDANLFFPYNNTLAYSDLFLISSVFSMIPLKIIGEPIVVVNFTFISSLVFLGFSIYLLSFYLTQDFFASLLAGVLVLFSPAVLDKATHLQILAIYFVPLSILFFIKFIKSQKSRYLIISLFFFLLQTYNSFLPGYFIIFSFMIIFFFSWIDKKKHAIKLVTKINFLILVFSFSLLLPIIIPYYQVSKEFDYVRDIRDSIHFALQPEDLLYPSLHTKINGMLLALPFNKTSQNGEFKPGYLGFVFSLLVVFAFLYFFRRIKRSDKIVKCFLVIGFTGLILSLGPVLHLGRETVHKPFFIPLPYALFYYIFPGFQGFRNSSRWEMLFILASSVVIAIMFKEIFNKKQIIIKVAVYIFLIFAIIAEFNPPIHFEQIIQKKDFPKVYSWLASTPKDAVSVIMPIYNWNMVYSGEELKRDYFSTINFRRTVNGYSGFSPPPWQELIYKLHSDFPSDESVNIIKNLGVNYIIVDKFLYDKAYKEGNENYKGESIVTILKKNTRVKLILKSGDHYIFKFVKN